jgi:hypothetical protein
MTYTTTTWNTLTVAEVKGFVIVYRKDNGAQVAAEAPVVLVQHDPDTLVRREVFAAVDKSTGELIPAPDVPGYIATVTRDAWRNDCALALRGDFTPAPGELA